MIQLTAAEVESFRQMRLAARASSSYWEVYQSLASLLTTKYEVPANDSTVVWLLGAAEANAGRGAMSALIRGYTTAQYQIRYAETAPDLQSASNAVAENLLRNLLGENGGLEGLVPPIKDIAEADARGVGQVVFSRDVADAAAGENSNSAWSGAMLFSMLGSDQSGRLIATGNLTQLDTMSDLRDVLYAGWSFKAGLLDAIGTTLANIATGSPQLATDSEILGRIGFWSKLIDVASQSRSFWDVVLNGSTGATRSALEQVKAVGGFDRFLDMVRGASEGRVVLGQTIDATFADAAHDFFAHPAVQLQSQFVRLLSSNAGVLASAARSDVNIRAALGGLSIVSLQVAEGVAQRFALYDSATGLGAISDNWIDDRSVMTALVARNDSSLSGGTLGINVGSSARYRDVASGVQTFIGNAFSNQIAQIVFGAESADSVDGSGASDHLYGGDGADTLSGLGGDDYLEGDDGPDSLNGGAGSDVLIGGDGGDTLIGGDGNDSLDGGLGVDLYRFAGMFGNDTIVDADGMGSITIEGIGILAGNSSLKLAPNVWESQDGKTHYAVVNQGSSQDLIITADAAGVSGAITIKHWEQGQFGITLDGVVAGPSWSVTLTGDYQKDLGSDGRTYHFDASGNIAKVGMQAGADDWIAGGNANELIEGYGGNDFLAGWMGDDRIDGGDGDDVLYGGPGADVLSGGAGDDFIWGTGGAVNTGYLHVVVLDHWWEYATPPEPGPSGFLWWIMPNDVNIELGEMFDGGDIVGSNDSNLVFGGDGDDLIAAGNGDDVAHGDAGDDTVWGKGGADLLFGDDGDDALWGDGSLSAFLDWVWDPITHMWQGISNGVPMFSEGTLDESHGNDVLDGGSGDDKLVGQGRDDVLIGGLGDDWLWGDDYERPGATLGSLHGQDRLDGGDGDDRLFGGGSDDELLGGDGDDVLVGDNVSIIAGSIDGNDRLDGGDGDDRLFGGGGDDSLMGDAGNDWVQGDDGNDTLVGGEGDDVLLGSNGNDVLMGVEGNDVLSGGDGDDVLDGGEGVNSLYGGAGNDVLIGTDADYLNGGEGNDIYVIAAASGALPYIDDSTGVNFLDAGGIVDGFDLVTVAGYRLLMQSGRALAWLSADVDLSQFRITADGAGTEASSVSLQDVLAEGGRDGRVASMAIVDGELVDTATLTESVVLSGTSWADAISGGSNDDRLSGGEGDDRLDGGEGDDVIYGALGDDIIIGGGGNDVLFGGTVDGDDDGGADIYRFALGDGQDRIEGPWWPSESAQDTIVFGAGITATNIQIAVQDDGDVIVAYSAIDRVHLAESAISNIAALRFDDGTELNRAQFLELIEASRGWDDATVRGTPGDDVLNGTSGIDILRGYTGDDVLDGGAGADVLIGGTGHNVYRFDGASGSDVIVATVGEDATLHFTGRSLADLAVILDGSDLVISQNQNSTIRLRDYAAFAGTDAWRVRDAYGEESSISALLGAAPTQSVDLAVRREAFLAMQRAQFTSLAQRADYLDPTVFVAAHGSDTAAYQSGTTAFEYSTYLSPADISTSRMHTILTPEYETIEISTPGTPARYMPLPDFLQGSMALPAGAVQVLGPPVPAGDGQPAGAPSLVGYLIPATAGTTVYQTRIKSWHEETTTEYAAAADDTATQMTVIGGDEDNVIVPGDGGAALYRGEIDTGAGNDTVLLSNGSNLGLSPYGSDGRLFDWNSQLLSLLGQAGYSKSVYAAWGYDIDRGAGAWIDLGAGDDVAKGSDADDFIIGGAGSDWMDGQGGADTYYIERSAGSVDHIADLASSSRWVDPGPDPWTWNGRIHYELPVGAANADVVEFDAGIEKDDLSYAWEDRASDDDVASAGYGTTHTLVLYDQSQRFLEIDYLPELASFTYSQPGVETFQFATGETFGLDSLLQSIAPFGGGDAMISAMASFTAPSREQALSLHADGVAMSDTDRMLAYT